MIMMQMHMRRRRLIKRMYLQPRLYELACAAQLRFDARAPRHAHIHAERTHMPHLKNMHSARKS